VEEDINVWMEFRMAPKDNVPSTPSFPGSIMYGVCEAHNIGGFEGTGLAKAITEVEGKESALRKLPDGLEGRTG
jgi:hypothetical protein